MGDNRMGNNGLFVRGMARKCRELIERSDLRDSSLPVSLQSKHLLRMCDRIERHAEAWPETRLHRWIGFVQGAMMANRMLELGDAKVMFEAVKNKFAVTSEDPDLIDHLDPNSPFEMDLGGQG